jgi:hypothetical protein
MSILTNGNLIKVRGRGGLILSRLGCLHIFIVVLLPFCFHGTGGDPQVGGWHGHLLRARAELGPQPLPH